MAAMALLLQEEKNLSPMDDLREVTALMAETSCFVLHHSLRHLKSFCIRRAEKLTMAATANNKKNMENVGMT